MALLTGQHGSHACGVMDWYDHGGWGWGGWVLMAMLMIVFWTAAVAAVYVLIRSTRQHDTPPSSDQAVRILDERLARGEIDAEEYAIRRDLLRSP